ncbi:MAG: T9SS type A sorting domain-containing protein [Sphingobacteriales bacterium]|nr:T9SS type A sorting domain-containing protein [Sphingobacteriales bacterium]
MKHFLFSLFRCFGILLFMALPRANAQLTLHISSIPANTPANASIYVAGNFNSWNPADSDYILAPQSDGSYTFTFTPALSDLEFKFTRGSWQTVEGSSGGGFLPNRTYTYNGGTATYESSIAAWEDLGGNNNNSTANAQVSIIAEDFYIPQLNRYRRIWIYLPADYTTDLNRHYPVLYMHDGQNVFDAATSFAGEWEVDETLTQMEQNGEATAIVVAIDNGGTNRLAEYTPYPHSSYGGGDGDKYIQFIVNTLKPYIDDHYRTLPQRENTALMGSSLGGLISFYAAIKYPEVFGKAGVFSPSFWFSDNIFQLADTAQHNLDTRIFMLCGGNEGDEDMVPDMQQMYQLLQSKGYGNEAQSIVKADGQHSEWFWAREFEGAFKFLFSEVALGTAISDSGEVPSFFPNPANGELYFHSPTPCEVRLFDNIGRAVWQQTLSDGDSIQLHTALPKGIYIAEMRQKYQKTTIWQKIYLR